MKKKIREICRDNKIIRPRFSGKTKKVYVSNYNIFGDSISEKVKTELIKESNMINYSVEFRFF